MYCTVCRMGTVQPVSWSWKSSPSISHHIRDRLVKTVLHLLGRLFSSFFVCLFCPFNNCLPGCGVGQGRIHFILIWIQHFCGTFCEHHIRLCCYSFADVRPFWGARPRSCKWAKSHFVTLMNRDGVASTCRTRTESVEKDQAFIKPTKALYPRRQCFLHGTVCMWCTPNPQHHLMPEKNLWSDNVDAALNVLRFSYFKAFYLWLSFKKAWYEKSCI